MQNWNLFLSSNSMTAKPSCQAIRNGLAQSQLWLLMAQHTAHSQGTTSSSQSFVLRVTFLIRPTHRLPLLFSPPFTFTAAILFSLALCAISFSHSPSKCQCDASDAFLPFTKYYVHYSCLLSTTFASELTGHSLNSKEDRFSQIQGKILYNEGDEILAQAVQRSGGCPISGNIQTTGWMGLYATWCLKQPGRRCPSPRQGLGLDDL